MEFNYEIYGKLKHINYLNKIERKNFYNIFLGK